MAGNFKFRNRDWNLSYSFHLTHSDSLLKIADSFDLELSCPIQQVLTQYIDNANNVNSVINLFLLCPNSFEINNHHILPELYYPSDYTFLTIYISITEKFIIPDKESLELIVQEYVKTSESI